MRVAHSLPSARVVYKAEGSGRLEGRCSCLLFAIPRSESLGAGKGRASEPFLTHREARLHLETLPSWPTKTFRILICN